MACAKALFHNNILKMGIVMPGFLSARSILIEISKVGYPFLHVIKILVIGRLVERRLGPLVLLRLNKHHPAPRAQVRAKVAQPRSRGNQGRRLCQEPDCILDLLQVMVLSLGKGFLHLLERAIIKSLVFRRHGQVVNEMHLLRLNRDVVNAFNVAEDLCICRRNQQVLNVAHTEVDCHTILEMICPLCATLP